MKILILKIITVALLLHVVKKISDVTQILSVVSNQT